MTAAQRFNHLSETWFLTEPLMYLVYCMHRLQENCRMQCAVRSGMDVIEYNPALVEAMSDDVFTETMYIEMVRLLLKHPYRHQPYGCLPLAQHLASDVCIATYYTPQTLTLTRAEDFMLEEGRHYEWYVIHIDEILRRNHPTGDKSNTGDSGGNSGEGEGDSSNFGNLTTGEGNSDGDGGEGEGDGDSGTNNADNASNTNEGAGGTVGAESILPASGADAGGNGNVSGGADAGSGKASDGAGAGDTKENDYTALWDDLSPMGQRIDQVISQTNNWGSLSGKLQEVIKRSTQGHIDYRKVLSAFMTSVLSDNRRPTRLKPNRRFGNLQLGYRREYTSRLLVALDVSGSIRSDTLSRFLNVIVRFTRYGFKEVDVIQFDTEIQGQILPLNKIARSKEFAVTGRGGTDFQPVVNFTAANPKYDGLLLFTDGCAPVPEIPPTMRARIMWVLDSVKNYERLNKNLTPTGRVCYMEL